MSMRNKRFYTTISEAKQLMKLSIYKDFIEPNADMFYIHELLGAGKIDWSKGVIDVGTPNDYPNVTPAWSTNALIRILIELGLMVVIDDEGVLIESANYPSYNLGKFTIVIDGTCLPWMLVKVLKDYDKKYGTK